MERHRIDSLSNFLFFVLAALGLFSCAAPEQHAADDQSVRPLLVDTDMGLDDVRALFALLIAHEVDICGIVTVEGSASIGKGTDNVIGLLETLHLETVPVYRGVVSAGLQPPAWRRTANTLGGAPFAPPRGMRAVDDATSKLETIFSREQQEIEYLALGPLGNLARLEKSSPGTLAFLKTLWIPVRSTSRGAVTEWNLLCDRASTETVFAAANNIVLIDLSAANSLDAQKLFSRMTPVSDAGRWIGRTLSGGAGDRPHLMVFDELAAAVLIEPGLLTIDRNRWHLDTVTSDAVELAPDRDGNISVARLTDPEAAAAILLDHWTECPHQDHSSSHEHRSREESSVNLSTGDLLRAFHGHLGPYVVLGYRMGRLALEKTNCDGYFDVSVEIHSILEPPVSCLIDGVQLGSGCTMGKRNITLEAHSGPAYGVFRTDGGETITIHLRPEIPGQISSMVDDRGVEPVGEFYLEADIETLFIVE